MIFEGELVGLVPKNPPNGERFIEIKVAVPFTLKTLAELGRYFGSPVQAEIKFPQPELFEQEKTEER